MWHRLHQRTKKFEGKSEKKVKNSKIYLKARVSMVIISYQQNNFLFILTYYSFFILINSLFLRKTQVSKIMFSSLFSLIIPLYSYLFFLLVESTSQQILSFPLYSHFLFILYSYLLFLSYGRKVSKIRFTSLLLLYLLFLILMEDTNQPNLSLHLYSYILFLLYSYLSFLILMEEKSQKNYFILIIHFIPAPYQLQVKT